MKTTKRIISLLMCALLVFGLVGCTRTVTTVEVDETESTTAADSATVTTAANDDDTDSTDATDAEGDVTGDDADATTSASTGGNAATTTTTKAGNSPTKSGAGVSKSTTKVTTVSRSGSTASVKVTEDEYLQLLKKYSTDPALSSASKFSSTYTLRIATPSKSLYKWMYKSGEKNENTGKLYTQSKIDDLRYSNLESISSQYNFKLDVQYYTDASETYSALIMSGASASVPQVLTLTCYSAGNFMAAGLLKPITSLRYVSTAVTKQYPWWDATQTANSMMNGKSYIATGAFTIEPSRSWYMAYNKNIADSIGLSEATLADLVINNKWTWTEFEKWCEKAKKDLNGDGKFDENDQWGFSSPRTDYTYAMMETAGVSLVSLSNGTYSYALNNDKAITVLTRLQNNVTSGKYRYPVENNSSQMTAFATVDGDGNAKTGYTLFYAYQLNGLLSNIKDCGDMGLIPMPMYDGETEYKALVDHNNYCIVVPKTTKTEDLEAAGLCLEAMAYGCWKTIEKELDIYDEYYLDKGDTLSRWTLSGIYSRTSTSPYQYLATDDFNHTAVQPMLVLVATKGQSVSGTVKKIQKATQALIDDFFGQ